MVSASGVANGNHARQPVQGVFAPLMTFFLPGSENIDVPTFTAHAARIAQAGVGLVALGSMGEAVHLTPDERNILVSAARSALDSNNPSHLPLIVGTGANTTRQTIEFTKAAAERGADYAMVIAPGYFVGAMGRDALKAFFVEVADASPIPIIIYNYPGASAGIDLDSDLITEIANASSNIVGVKLTCGSVGKLTRLISLRPPFAVLGGFVDFLGPSLMLKSAGGITGTGNLFPKSCLQLYNLSKSGLAGSASDLQKAIKLQELVSKADWTLGKVGIAGNKWVLAQTAGYGGECRRPILPFKGDGQKLLLELDEILKYEKSL